MWRKPRRAAEFEEGPRVVGSELWGARITMVSPALAAAGNQTGGKRTTAQFVRTPQFDVPLVFVVQWKFASSPDPGAASQPNPSNSVTGPIRIRIRRGIDKANGIDERIFDGVGYILPTIIIGHSLEISVETTAGHVESTITIDAAISCAVDESTLQGATAGALGGYATTTVTRVAAAAADTLLLAPGFQGRRQFIISNNSSQDLAVLFGAGVPSLAAGAENFTVLLPPGAQYESPIGGYTGEVRGIWRAADAAGEALVTDGRIP